MSEHFWRGGRCTACGERFRCYCGRFVKVEDIDAHVQAGCPAFERLEGSV